VNEVLKKTRHEYPVVTASTPLATLDLESIDYVEIFIVLEERTGAVFDLSSAPSDLHTVADLARYRLVAPRSEEHTTVNRG